MQIRNRTFFISDNVSDHYHRRFAKEILLRSGKLAVSPDDHADYVIYDAGRSMMENQNHSCIKITVNEMVSIFDCTPRTVSDGFCVTAGVLVKWIPEESQGHFLTIPSGVIRIASDAFRPVYPCQDAVFRKAMKKVQRIIFPKTLEVIEQDAFRGFADLETIRLREGIRELGGFRGCRRLDGVVIPESCTKIGDYAFSGCRLLSHLQWSGNITEIGKNAFAGTGLPEFTSWDSLEKIGDSAFSKCGALSEVFLQGNAPECGRNAFRNSGIQKLTVDLDSCVLGSHCFAGCDGLDEINVRRGKITIAPDTFPSSVIKNALEKLKDEKCTPAEYDMWTGMIRKYGRTFFEQLPPVQYFEYAELCAGIAGIRDYLPDVNRAAEKEAALRLKWLIRNLGLNPNVLKYFKQGKLYYSYMTAGGFMGSVDTITYEPLYVQIVREAERLFGIHVYHAVETYGFGRELILLYVEQDFREWEYSRPESSVLMAYVYNLEFSEGEFGYVELDSFMGALYRIG